MATKNEKMMIDTIYQQTVSKAEEKIAKQLAEDQEERGFEHGSALYGVLKRDLEKATAGINVIYEYNEEYDMNMVATHENNVMKYDATATRLLKAVEAINTYVL